ncbi:MAG TPA: DUF5719 family protein [Acidimicrobiales bacterium]|nr:DUF5719 family protein [Acidimicrobiales bacterium]
MKSDRRFVAIAILAAVLVVVGALDRADRPPLTPAGARLATAYAPAASPPDALTSTWYCPAGTASGGSADSTVVVFNPTGRRLRGSVDVFGSDGNRGSRSLSVGPRERVAVREADVLKAAYVAAMVRLDGGGATVEHATTGPLGEAVGTCASSASTNWYVPEGATTRSAQLIYALFNPFPDDAIVDMSFATEQGRDAPAAFQGIVVPANGLVPLDVGTHVRRRAHVSAAIHARRGRVVVEALQTHNGDGRRGVGLMLGLPRTATSFVFPDGIASPERFEQLHLFNPNRGEASVQLDLVLDAGKAQPFQLRVPAQGRITVDLTSESRVPKNVGHALLLRVSNGVPIAVSRTTDVGPPAARRGYLTDEGATAAALHWGFAAGGVTPGLDEWIAVINEAPTAVTVDLTTLTDGRLTALAGLNGVRIPRGGRRVFRLADHGATPDTPIIVNATGPVVAERTLYSVGGTGTSAVMGAVLSTAEG